MEALAAFASAIARRHFHWEAPEKNTAEATLDIFRQETVYGAYRDGRLVGVMSLWEPDAFVHYLYAEPQGQGTGPALLKVAAGLFDRPLTLKCAEANPAAMRFYEREGWVAIEHNDGDGGPPWRRMQAPAGY